MNPQEDQSHILPQVSVGNDSADGINTVQNSAAAPQSPIQSAATQPSDDGVQLEAEDVDLIEKAWVEKAKSIVDSTQGDPYAQNERLSKMKSDYLKKRYNKVIETGDKS